MKTTEAVTPMTDTLSTPRGASDDEACWRSVQRRDPAADGAFVYAVVTTGVYCRPSCPSREARREHVRFYADATAAVAAGFRPCRRCRPDVTSPAPHHATAIAEACREIVRAIDAGEPTPGLAALAATAGLSRHHFHRLFRAATGVTPRAFAATARAAALRDRLAEGGRVTDAIHAAGYGSSSRAYEATGARLGMTPSVFRDGGRGENIRFAIAQCSLGTLLAAATGIGICALSLGDDARSLEEEFRGRFSNATLVGDDAAFADLVARVIASIDTPGDRCDLPLDVRGTAFQQRVWQALQQIPSGSTDTYAGIAERIGRPKAARAVAGACAANPVAVVIPCHRAVRGDGGLGGYRWGLDRKRQLLARERSDKEAGS
jgi:O-6-methylguanine DNA methyltransferase